MYPKAAPPSRVVRGEELPDLFRAVKGAFHNLVSSSCTSGRMAPEGGSENQHDFHRETTRPASKNRMQWRIPHEPDILSGLGKLSHLARTTLSHPKGATQPSRHPRRESARPLMQQSTSGHQGEHRRKRVVYLTLQRSQPDPTAPPPAAECLRGEELHLGKPSP